MAGLVGHRNHRLPGTFTSTGKTTAQVRPFIHESRPDYVRLHTRQPELSCRKLLWHRSAVCRTRRLGFRLRTSADLSKKPEELSAGKSGPFSSFDNFTEALTTLFPVWVCIGAIVGVSRPQTLAWFKPEMFTVSLGFLMLSMGLTLTIENFRECISRPKPILFGYAAQYVVKPLLGFLISKVLKLPPALAVGLILVSCCPGGQASNVATYIAHGDVALSVLMTTASTLGAIIMTPLLTGLLAGTLVPVDARGLALSTFQVVLVPTLVGVSANELAPGLVRRIKRVLPLLGVALTTLLCASPVAQVADLLRLEGAALVTPVALLHVAAFGMGYFLSKIVGFNEKTARTVSIETGMQSAALGFLLAREHFADPLVAVPSAVSVVFMALGGSGLAVFWRNKPTPASEGAPAPA